MLVNSRTGKEREVDVVAETRAMYPLRIGIEVRDRGRPADVEWVDQAIGKLADLGINKKVLWSAKGFTPNALALAKAHDIDTVTPADASSAPWSRLARELQGGALLFVQPTFTIPHVDVELEDGSRARWAVLGNTEIAQRDGEGRGTIGMLLQVVITDYRVRTTLLDHAAKGGGDAHAIFQLPTVWEMRGENERSAGLQK